MEIKFEQLTLDFISEHFDSDEVLAPELRLIGVSLGLFSAEVEIDEWCVPEHKVDQCGDRSDSDELRVGQRELHQRRLQR